MQESCGHVFFPVLVMIKFVLIQDLVAFELFSGKQVIASAYRPGLISEDLVWK